MEKRTTILRLKFTSRGPVVGIYPEPTYERSSFIVTLDPTPQVTTTLQCAFVVNVKQPLPKLILVKVKATQI